MQSENLAVRLNGEDRILNRSTNVANLLVELGLDPACVVVEVDGVILTRDRHPKTILRDGAQIEIVHFVGGG